MEHLREDDKEEVSTETSIKMGTSPLDSGADVFEDEPADAVDGVKVAWNDQRSNTGARNKIWLKRFRITGEINPKVKRCTSISIVTDLTNKIIIFQRRRSYQQLF